MQQRVLAYTDLSMVSVEPIDLELRIRAGDRGVFRDFWSAVFSQYRRELAVLFVICDVLLGLTLFTDFRSFVLHDTSKVVANASAVATTEQAPTETPSPTAASANTAATWPLHGHVTAEFGERTPYQRHHSGIDVSSYQRAGNASVSPVRAGTVVEAGRAGGLGNRVVVDHGEGIVATYAHLDSISVNTGQAVDTSSVIGKEGSTGNTTGPHLHLEIRKNGQLINPREFVSANPS